MEPTIGISTMISDPHCPYCNTPYAQRVIDQHQSQLLFPDNRIHTLLCLTCARESALFQGAIYGVKDYDVTNFFKNTQVYLDYKEKVKKRKDKRSRAEYMRIRRQETIKKNKLERTPQELQEIKNQRQETIKKNKLEHALWEIQELANR